MKILLDTCSVLWFLNGNEKMQAYTRGMISDNRNIIYVSIATVWEVAVKMSIGKLDFDGGIDGFIEAIDNEGFLLLEISSEHIKAITELPFIHRDPFDRMIIAQSMTENMPVITEDAEMLKYNIRLASQAQNTNGYLLNETVGKYGSNE